MPLDIYDDLSKPPEPGRRSARNRPYISVFFECCGVYDRIYRQHGQPCYHGRCPKCLRALHVRVGPDGTSDRMFRAS